jgi:hypothetical protein
MRCCGAKTLRCCCFNVLSPLYALLWLYSVWKYRAQCDAAVEADIRRGAEARGQTGNNFYSLMWPSFLLCGTGLVGLVCGWPRLAVVCGIGVTACAVLTLSKSLQGLTLPPCMRIMPSWQAMASSTRIEPLACTEG